MNGFCKLAEILNLSEEIRILNQDQRGIRIYFLFQPLRINFIKGCGFRTFDLHSVEILQIGFQG